MADLTCHRIKLQSDAIRVLVLEPTDEDLDDAFIQCRLVSTSIEKPVAYEALSYTWGDDALSPTRFIDCDGDVTPVTINLYEALLAMRYSDRPRTLWVDALCIDQSNNKERNHQVSLMARIDRKAAGVLIWVGNDGPAMDGERSFQYLRQLYDIVQSESKARKFVVGPNVPQPKGDAPWPHPSVEFALNLFLRRSWFRRRWVLQEVYHGRKVQIQCGHQSMSWEEFVVSFLRLYSADHRYRLPLPVFNIPHASRNLILDHLDLFDEHDCQDPRDRIFSLLSLDERNSFLPDYALTTPEVFTAFAQHSVMEGSGVHVLAQASWQPYTGRIASDLATWIPDWRRSVRDSRMLKQDVVTLGFSTEWKEELVLTEKTIMKDLCTGQQIPYDPITETVPQAQPPVRLSECKAKLIVRAHIVGTVVSWSRPFKVPATASRFGLLNVGKFVVRSDHPLGRRLAFVTSEFADTTTRPDGYLYEGYHSGDIECGDTVCCVSGSGLTVALRPRKDHTGEWQLVRWCAVPGFEVEDESVVISVDFCIAQAQSAT
ncbi:hypothetical protein LTR08_000464 [Meristemomyces frigidus]|nr:hypothetical protein LTR08_000464 [Meristemomyces frigidus]